MKNYEYKAEWSNYTYPEDESPFTNDEEIIKAFTGIDLDKKVKASGIPLLRKDGRVYLNNETENTIIFGETGSKKTRALIEPLMMTAAAARESAFISDVKGELSSNRKLINYIKSKGVKTVFLDFRNFSGDCYNILETAYKNFKRGNKDDAMNMVYRFVKSLSNSYEGSNADPFWQHSAEQYLMPVIYYMFDICSKHDIDYFVNMLTVSRFANYDDALKIQNYMKQNTLIDLESVNYESMLRTVVDNPEKTLTCIISTVQSMIRSFTIQNKLMKMLSYSSFDVSEMYAKPTFVFLIIPDETNTYDEIAGILIDTFYNTLIETYSRKYQNIAAPACRINYIIDEFCNLHINDMRSKISASRSRYMRWYLVCQSKSQLETVYSRDSGTIIGNCKNIFFLQSADIEMLGYISKLCGNTRITESKNEEPLISIDMLKKLKKEKAYKEAIFFRDDVKYLAELPDIDTYAQLNAYGSDKPFVIENKCPEKIESVTSILLIKGFEWAKKEREENKRNPFKHIEAKKLNKDALTDESDHDSYDESEYDEIIAKLEELVDDPDYDEDDDDDEDYPYDEDDDFPEDDDEDDDNDEN